MIVSTQGTKGNDEYELTRHLGWWLLRYARSVLVTVEVDVENMGTAGQMAMKIWVGPVGGSEGLCANYGGIRSSQRRDWSVEGLYT